MSTVNVAISNVKWEPKSKCKNKREEKATKEKPNDINKLEKWAKANQTWENKKSKIYSGESVKNKVHLSKHHRDPIEKCSIFSVVGCWFIANTIWKEKCVSKNNGN